MEDNGRPYFTFLRSYYEAIEQCPEGVQLELYRALALYGLNKIEPSNMSPLSKTLWSLIKPLLDRQWVKFENGRKGGAPSEALMGNQNAKRKTENKPKTNLTQTENKSKPSEEKERDKEKDEDNTPNGVVVYDASRPLTLFEGWLKRECPYIFGHYKLLTEAELEKLKAEYGSEAIADVCQQIENRKDLRSKYTNLYRTLLNWLKRNAGSGAMTGGAPAIVPNIPMGNDLAVQRAYNVEVARELGKQEGKKLAKEQTKVDAMKVMMELMEEDEPIHQGNSSGIPTL